MEYERLTVKRNDKNYIKTPVDGVHDFLVITNRVGKYEYTTGEVIDRLAELEDKIENGTLKEIPENAVVLTEQEQNKILKAIEKRIDQLKKQVELTRKETALKIRNYIKQHTELGDYYAGECYDELDIWSFDRFLKEKFGVEVEE